MSIKEGIKAALPIVLGYIPVGIAFGLISANGDMPLYFVIMLSSIVFAGASQFMAVHSVAAAISYPQIIVATFLMNFRHVIMSMSIASRLEAKSKKYKGIIAFFVTDESFAVTSFNKKLNHRYMLGVQITAYLTWNIFTVIGYFVGGLLPQLIQNSMGITLYVLFAALLIPELKKSQVAIVVSIAGALINSLLRYLTNLDAGWCLVLAILLASLIGYIYYDEDEEVLVNEG